MASLPPIVLPPPPNSGGKKKKETPKQRAANAAAYQKAKSQNPYFQGELFQSKWHDQIDPIFEAYSGRPATKAQAQRVIALGWSNYHLQVWLSGQRSFVNSPVWKTNAPSYNAVYNNIMGGGRKAPKKWIAYAIIHNLGSTGFEQYIRTSKEYTTSTEFKNNVASMQNVYQSIYGAVDPDALHAIKSATLAGWSSDQFAKYLRSQPQYQQSDEFQSNMNKLADAFGFAPTLTQAQALASPTDFGGIPQDQRLGPAPSQQQLPGGSAAQPPRQGGQLAGATPKPQPMKRP